MFRRPSTAFKNENDSVGFISVYNSAVAPVVLWDFGGDNKNT